MKKMFKVTAAAAMVGLMAFAAGCGGGSDKKAATMTNEVVKFGVTNFADSLEPTDNFFSWVVMRYGLGECLVKFDEKMNFTPMLSDKWSISDDKLTWTFHIRPNVKFSNGDVLTADIAAASLKRTFEKSNRAQSIFQYDSITADGENLVIKTKNPTPTLPGMLADPLFIIINTNAVAGRDIAKEGPICTGPYMVKSYTKAKASMVANPNYWNGAVPFKTAEIPTIDDPSTRAMALQKGEIDFAINIAPGDLQLFKNNKFNISEIASLRTVLAQINMNEGRVLSDPKVRAALIQCLDRETYNKVLLKDTFIPGKAPVPPSLDYGFDQLKDPNAYNVENAKKLLAEAGWKDTDGDGYVDKDGKNCEIDFVFYSGRAELPLYAEATQADAKKIGIKVNMKNVDYNVLDPMRQRGEFDLCISNILTANTGDPEVYLNWYWKTNVNGSQPQNSTGYSNAKFDELSDKLAVEFDPAKRRELMIGMQQELLNDGAALFFGYPKTNMVSKASVADANIYPADYYWLTSTIKPAAAK